LKVVREMSTHLGLRTAIVVSGFIAASTGVVLVATLAGRAVNVEIQNGGPGPLRGVVVDAFGRSYSVGDIEAGESRACAFGPSEGGFTLEVADMEGRRSTHAVDCYLTPSSRGNITIRFENGRITWVDDRAEISFW
jgi:hypothetical protein